MLGRWSTGQACRRMISGVSRPLSPVHSGELLTCQSDRDPDAAFGVPLQACAADHVVEGSYRVEQPERRRTPPRRGRSIASSGTTPDPPAISWTGASGSHTNQPPIGPRISSGSPTRGRRRGTAIPRRRRPAAPSGPPGSPVPTRWSSCAAPVAVRRGQPDVHVLPRQMPGPPGRRAPASVRPRSRRRRRPWPPARSVAGVSLFAPWVPVLVVAEPSPRSRAPRCRQLQAAHPLRGFQKYRCGTSSRAGPPCSGVQRLTVVLVRDPGLAIGEVVQRQVRGVPAVADAPARSPPRSRRPRAGCRGRRRSSRPAASTTG